MGLLSSIASHLSISSLLLMLSSLGWSSAFVPSYRPSWLLDRRRFAPIPRRHEADESVSQRSVIRVDSRLLQRLRRHAVSSDDSAADESNTDDWRSFRARLVAGGLEFGNDTQTQMAVPPPTAAATAPPPSPSPSPETIDDEEAAARELLSALEEGEPMDGTEVESLGRTWEGATTPMMGGGPTWAHELPMPEKGCLLLACPGKFPFQQYFNRAVVFITDYGDSTPYTCGIILNRPTEFTLGELMKGVRRVSYDGAAGSEDEADEQQGVPGGSGEMEDPLDDKGKRGLEVFNANTLYMGGDVGRRGLMGDALIMMHPHGTIRGARKVIDEVYVGGDVEECVKMIQTGKAEASDFKFFRRYCAWAPNQLESEVQRGVWYVAACDKDTLLSNYPSPEQPTALWKAILRRMGERNSKYRLIAGDG
ncbi:unnamed protein product [Vitrella brassicaformis CCMP3155]|uniref:Uncharacterized protein n=2 Tax=Vitrella brassicaformis TaxID=1169539 RepID=A0A0G4F736_VITBC|nr:unnamed protein product [Vitrella brassicaformis CCMP3155]|eukprot:CEM08043.1 unnamed protein product [Vitrella brassicaformis CCMP3155]